MGTDHANVTAVLNDQWKLQNIENLWFMDKTVIAVNVPLKWTIKDNNAFAKDKLRCSRKKVPWKYGANS